MKPVLLAGVALLLGAAPALADTLVDNVDGVTLDASNAVDHFTGLDELLGHFDAPVQFVGAG